MFCLGPSSKPYLFAPRGTLKIHSNTHTAEEEWSFIENPNNYTVRSTIKRARELGKKYVMSAHRIYVIIGDTDNPDEVKIQHLGLTQFDAFDVSTTTHVWITP